MLLESGLGERVDGDTIPQPDLHRKPDWLKCWAFAFLHANKLNRWVSEYPPYCSNFGSRLLQLKNSFLHHPFLLCIWGGHWLCLKISHVHLILSFDLFGAFGENDPMDNGLVVYSHL